MTKPLDGAVAIVTGSAMNIGREICLQLARMGASVVTHAHENRAGAEETKSWRMEETSYRLFTSSGSASIMM